MIIPKWLLASGILLLAACSSKNEPPQQATSANVYQINMKTSASVNCVAVGGTPTLSHNLNGQSINMCQLANGKQCEEWALLQGACPAR